MLKTEIYIGIDPGITGGIVIIDKHCNLLECIKVPIIKTLVGKTKAGNKKYNTDLNVEEIINLLATYTNDYSSTLALEKVHSTPNDGRVGAFKFGSIYGFWRGVGYCLCDQVIEVSPQKWTKRMLPNKIAGAGKSESLKVAHELFGDCDKFVPKHSGVSDALLIAECVRIQYYD